MGIMDTIKILSSSAFKKKKNLTSSSQAACAMSELVMH